MKQRIKSAPPGVKPTNVDRVYRKARKRVRPTEDEALNAMCDARIREPRRLLAPLLKKLGHDVE